jgi:small subunit ribosomal protein S17
MSIMSEAIKSKRTVTGRVVSNKMDKTIIVLLERKVPHPKYGKYVTRRTKLFVHDEQNVCQLGDWVAIQESRPLSKNKNWMLIEVLEKAKQNA